MPAKAFSSGTASEPMLQNRLCSRHWLPAHCLWLLLLGACCHAQTCQSAADMDPSVRSALETTAKRYFDMSAHGDVSALKQNSIAAVANSFSVIEGAVKDNQAAFTGAQAMVRPPFLLTAEGVEPLARAEFLCGVFGKTGQTKDSAEFVLPNLPPGKYAVVILDVTGEKASKTLTFVLQQVGPDWKLAGFYPRASQTSGHDAAWFIQRARDFKAKGQNHNALLYYREAIALSSPVDFMNTLATDKLYDEIDAVLPADVPVNGKTADLSAGGKTYHLIEISPRAVGDDLELVAKYQAADVSDTARAFQENTAVIKALLARYPELRDAFAGILAQAVDPAGRDFGTLLAMKDIK